ncbi:hypothetical protein EV424DRAFT_1355060 [Suillus variegatus]|nr:hypothetical protein EV424DRAFT_1355060 [Suillus variegatus]
MTDGPGGKLFPMEAGGPMQGIYRVDGWAEVVGYYADGCIKVDVYEIDGHDGAEVVVHQPNQRRLSCRMWNPGCEACVALREAKFRPPELESTVPSSGTRNSTHNLVNTFHVKWPTEVEMFLKRAAECGIRGAKLVLPYEKPSSDHQNVSQPYSEEVINQSYRVPGAAGDLLTWLCEACVALRDSKFRPPKYGSTVPTSEFRDPGVDK